MKHRQILDLLDHTFAVELDRRRRIRWVNRAVAALEGQDPVSYCGCRPEELWAVREECGAAYHECLRRQAGRSAYEVWTGRGGVQRIVRVVRLPTRGGVLLIVVEDVMAAAQRAAAQAARRRTSSGSRRTRESTVHRTTVAVRTPPEERLWPQPRPAR